MRESDYHSDYKNKLQKNKKNKLQDQQRNKLQSCYYLTTYMILAVS